MLKVYQATLASCCAATLVLSLSACQPKGRAVGDTWQPSVTTAHDGVDRSNVLVSFVSPPAQARTAQTQQEQGEIFSVLSNNGMEAYYSPAQDFQGQVQAAEDSINRSVYLIAVMQPAAGDWTPVLRQARRVGIAVVSVNGDFPPSVDSTLYAARLDIRPTDQQAQPIGRALQEIIDDRPHSRHIAVNLQDDMALHQPPDMMDEVEANADQQ